MLYDKLKALNIEYKQIEHEAVFTVLEAQDILKKIDGLGCKNLFMKSNKNNYYLVILRDDKRADIKKLKEILKVSELSFAQEENLEQILKLQKGSVTPFGIINDKNNLVKLIIDKDLKNHKVLFHPNVNTKTISLNFDDLIKFIENEKHSYILF